MSKNKPMDTILKNKPILDKLELTDSDGKYVHYLNEIAEQHKSEYINDEIVIHSPAKKKHVDVSLNLVSIIRDYVVKFDLGFVGQEKILTKMRNSKNSYEPDICYFRKEKDDNFNDNTDVFPPPDWAIEIISKCSEDRDRKTKYLDYAKNGVEEYWLINTQEEKIEQYYLNDKNVYILIREYYSNDSIASITLPKLIIPLEAIFNAIKTSNFHFGKYEKSIKEKDDKLKEKDDKLKQKEKIIKKDKKRLKEKDDKLKEKDDKLKEKDDK